jgi:site-specific DNA recombinase
MRAAIYARYSSENQREASIEDQVRLCRQEAERRAFAVVATWQDAELSGQLTKRRPGLQAMLAAAKRGEFDVLIVDDAARLSRDGAEAQRLFKRLEFYRVGLIARSDGIDTLANPKSSRLIFGVKSAFNEEFLRDLAEKTWRGLEGRVLAGFSAGGLPYGYRSVPVPDSSGRADRYGNPVVVGYRREVYQPEAEVVCRIFRMYVGDEVGRPLSPREITYRLNAEGVPSPGARWQNRTLRVCKSWSYTAIIGHRRLRKGILNNPMYIGRVVWNRLRWLRDPDTEAYTYRVRPQDDWIEREEPSLRVVPQDLWDRAQALLAARRSKITAPARRGKYLLSGLVKCGVCGGPYIISNRFSLRCATNRSRGPAICPNGVMVPRLRLERAVLEAVRAHLYTPEALAALVAQVREALMARAKRAAQARARGETDRRLRALEAEIEHVKRAVAAGKATAMLLEMLEERVRERDALRAAAAEAASATDLWARLERVLARLPELITGYLEDLETLLAAEEVDRGRDILSALVEEVHLHPLASNGAGPAVEAEVRGDVRRVLRLVARTRGSETRGGGRWLGEEDSNPH